MLYILGILIEVAVLFYLERKAWGTMLTPLNILMLPYVAVLLISLAMAGHSGFVEFYYPSILLWNVGLVFFALPSFLLAGYAHRNGYDVRSTTIIDNGIPRIFIVIGVVLVAMMMYHLLGTVRSSKFIIGSDEFAEEFVGYREHPEADHRSGAEQQHPHLKRDAPLAHFQQCGAERQTYKTNGHRVAQYTIAATEAQLQYRR